MTNHFVAACRTSAATAMATVSVCESDTSTPVAPTLGEQRLALFVEHDQRFLARTVGDRDRPPSEFGADARRERLRDGLLGGESGGEVLLGELAARAIGALLVGEDALEKALALALEHAADALDLDHVAAEAEEDAARGQD